MVEIKIERIEERSRMTPEGEFVPTIKVYYSTAKGFKGSIMLDKKEATVERIKELVRKDAERFDALIGAKVVKEKKE